MRLLNTTSIEVERFTGKVPPYAILSHRWEEEEVTLEDMKPGGAVKGMNGYRKLRIGCAMAAREGLKYIWIDTCCIDKTSSAELSEAINSMFRYYREAVVCYAYLADVSSVNIVKNPSPSILEASDFYGSAWFTRGWTLQELIAPKNLKFYNKEWDYLGNKADFKGGIRSVTKIPEKILVDGDLTDESVSRKMSWVASRQTTVPEDIAYCLLGVFDANIPLLYGEGEEKAFLRLQEAILKSSDDNSIFLWRSTEEEAVERPFWGLLAKSPSYFLRSPDIAAPCTMTMATNTAATLTGRGVEVEFLLAPIPNDPSESIYAALIFVDGANWAYGPLLQKLSYSRGQFARVGADILLEIDNNMRIKYAKLPQRISSYRKNIYGIFEPGEFDYVLKEPHALRFYVRQNPKLSPGILKEAAGFSVDTENSLPLELSVNDWSTRWSRWEWGLFSSSGPTYLLEFEADHQRLGTTSITTKGMWESESFGVLRLSEIFGASRNLTLCAGLQRISVNFLNTPLPYERPFCFIYEESHTAENSDQILKKLSNQFSVLEKMSQNSGYSTSFELQIRSGQVYYLIKVRRLLATRIDGNDVSVEMGS